MAHKEKAWGGKRKASKTQPLFDLGLEGRQAGKVSPALRRPFFKPRLHLGGAAVAALPLGHKAHCG